MTNLRAQSRATLEQALIAGYGNLGWVVTSRSYTSLVRRYGLRQEFITLHCPEQNDMLERVIWTLKEQRVHRHRFESLQRANRVIASWIGFHNNRRPASNARDENTR